MSRLLELEMLGEKPLVRGQLFFRDSGTKPEGLPPGMKLMMVCGVVAVPENFPINTEEQVRLRGFANRDSVELHTEVEGKKLKGYDGCTFDHVMMSPIWKF